MLASNVSFAQNETFDLITYTPPKDWVKELKNDVVSYTYVNKKDKSWCQIGIFKSTLSKGNVNDDFKHEWETLVVQQYKTTRQPQISTKHTDGWDIISGATNFIFNNDETAVVLTTFSGFGVCTSVVAVTPYIKYFKDLENLMETIRLQIPSTQTEDNHISSENSIHDNYSFTISNFEDGWKSEVKKDWVEVTKGDLKVLLHYSNDNIKAANTDLDVMCAAAWNVLIAPRYKNIKNYQLTPGVIEYERPYYAQAELTENSSGKNVFVVLFKKGTGWMEFIAPDKNTFLKTFGVDINTINYSSDSNIWEPLKKMADYNKFAVAQSDFIGKWTDKFTGNTYYANIYTGTSAGMNTYTSTQSFEFKNNNYSWYLIAANSFGGQSEFGHVKSNGMFKVVNNWQIFFSDIEGKPKTYNVYFSAIKGGRILWISDTDNPNYIGFSQQ